MTIRLVMIIVRILGITILVIIITTTTTIKIIMIPTTASQIPKKLQHKQQRKKKQTHTTYIVKRLLEKKSYQMIYTPKITPLFPFPCECDLHSKVTRTEGRGHGLAARSHHGKP